MELLLISLAEGFVWRWLFPVVGSAFDDVDLAGWPCCISILTPGADQIPPQSRLVPPSPAAGGDATDLNTLVFRMSVKGKSASSSSGDIEAGLEGDEDNTQGPYTNVYASQLVWEPQGGQEEALPVRAAPVNGDILLAKVGARRWCTS